MKRKTTFFFAGAILCLLLAVRGYYLYHKPRAGVAAASADAALTAASLYTAFLQNEQAATGKYLGKVIEVTGTVTELDKDASGMRSVLLSAGNVPGGVNCSLAPATGQSLPRLEKGATIRVKGRCSGFLMDVNLTDAVIEQ